MPKTRLQELRIEKGISQAKLGKVLGVKDSTVWGWEQDYRQMDFDMLIKVCDFFNVSTDYFLKRKDY